MCRHTSELVLRQVEIAKRVIKLPALVGIRRSHFESGLREAGRPSTRLQPSSGKPCHLQIEASIESPFFPNQILSGYEVIFKVKKVGMHAPIPKRRNRISLQEPTGWLSHLERMAREGV